MLSMAGSRIPIACLRCELDAYKRDEPQIPRSPDRPQSNPFSLPDTGRQGYRKLHSDDAKLALKLTTSIDVKHSSKHKFQLT